MSSDTRRDRGLLPPTQDVMAILVLGAAYFMRIASAADPDVATPEVLVLTTDMLIPVSAGLWLWVGAMFMLFKEFSD